MSALRYLDFEIADDGEGVVSFDALAAVPPAWADAVRAEVQGVLDWAQAQFGPPAPLDEGGTWDAACHESREGGRVLLALTLSGNAAWADALQARFDLQ